MRQKYFYNLILLAFLLVTSVVHGASNPALTWYQCDFRNLSVSEPMQGWSCEGSGKTPADVNIGESDVPLSNYFFEGGPSYVVMDFTGISPAMCSNSTTLEGGAVNEWLISPLIDLSNAPSDLLLSFTVLATGSENDAKFEVYVCEEQSSECIRTLVYSGKQKNSTTGVLTQTIHRALTGVGGKKIRISFLNRSRNAQILGFTNIKLTTYDIDFVNSTPSFVDTPQDVRVECKMSIMTPVDCAGYTAVLQVDGFDDQVYTSTKQLGAGTVDAVIRFPDTISITHGDEIEYSVAVRPNYENAIASVFNYTLSCSDGFPAVCVAEEGTGSWCQWCTRGVAALNMYSDLYPGRYFGIAVHSGDAMALDTYIPYINVFSFPGAQYNRKWVGDVFQTSAIEEIINRQVGEKISISSCVYDPETCIMQVSYAPTLAYSTANASMTAAVVVTIDGMKGEGKDWMQANAYSGMDKSAIELEYCEGAWLYFKPLCESKVMIPDFSFDHVALGIYNSYYGDGPGAELPSNWVAGQPQEFTIDFEMPLYARPGQTSVNPWQNTAVTVLLLDKESGEILGADRLEADNYTIKSAQCAAPKEDCSIIRRGDIIEINAQPQTQLSIFDLKGNRLHTSALSTGHTDIDATRWYFPILVQIMSGHTNIIRKIMP